MSGCATAPARPADRYLVALRYDVEPVLAEHGPEPGMDIVRHDLARAAELGFNCVLLGHVDERDVAGLLDAAAEVGLSLAVPSRSGAYFVRTGCGGNGPAGRTNLAGAMPRAVTAHAAFAAMVVERGADEESAQRSRRLAATLERRGVACAVWGRKDQTEGLATIRVGDAGASDTQGWLAQFHAGLAAGLTDGVVIDRYRATPGDPPGLASRDGSISPARVAALGEVLTRGLRWGRRLIRARAAPISQTPPPAEGDVMLVLLSQGRRSYVLVFNPATEGYLRREVGMPETVPGGRFHRAVEVPPSASRLAGRVVDARAGQLLLPVDLRPGDAALFELF